MKNNTMTKFTVEVTAPEGATIKREMLATVPAKDANAAAAQMKQFMAVGDQVRVYEPFVKGQFKLYILATVTEAPNATDKVELVTTPRYQAPAENITL